MGEEGAESICAFPLVMMSYPLKVKNSSFEGRPK